MVITIPINETTKQLLDNFKVKIKSNSYDKVIQELLVKRTKAKEMFGFTKKKPLNFSKHDELSFNEV